MPKDGLVPLDAAAGGADVRQDEQPSDRPRLPSEAFLDHAFCQPDLFVMFAEGRLDRCEFRLDLDD